MAGGMAGTSEGPISAERRTRLLALLPAPPGLCEGCLHLKLQTNGRSVFARCLASRVDPRAPRYPRLPVVSCRWFEDLEDALPD